MHLLRRRSWNVDSDVPIYNNEQFFATLSIINIPYYNFLIFIFVCEIHCAILGYASDKYIYFSRS